MAIEPKKMAELLTHPNSPLLIDIRSSQAYQASHVFSAHSWSIPTLFLKRPIDRIVSLLPDQSEVKQWLSGHKKGVVLYDLDSQGLKEGSPLAILVEKLDCKWLYGGFNMFSKDYPELCVLDLR
jgi:hypothetical protein